MIKTTDEFKTAEVCDLCEKDFLTESDPLSFPNEEKAPIMVHRECLKKLVQDTINAK
jgi:hypothetical protein